MTKTPVSVPCPFCLAPAGQRCVHQNKTRRRFAPRAIEPDDPIDPALRAIAAKIVQRTTIGRRWYFHNGVCVAFFRAPEGAS
ncbi:MAG TPA: hypothetical protein VLE97_07325 [Gaiellaceae bacterium]|nr:hypothetical protein [Gaiellaceae bacterium]